MAILQYALVVAIGYAIYLVFNRVQQFQLLQAVRKREKTQEPPKHPRQGFLGLAIYRDALRHAEDKTFLDWLLEVYEQVGDTFSYDFLGQHFVDTRDPENIKAILSTQFDQFSLGDPRCNSFHSMFGDGIFTLNGKDWQQSRAMLRPQFVKQQIQDLGVLEKFVQRLITRIPRDGKTVDLQDCFFRLSMDTGMDLLHHSYLSLEISRSNHPNNFHSYGFPLWRKCQQSSPRELFRGHQGIKILQGLHTRHRDYRETVSSRKLLLPTRRQP
jgi:hypothetical protein